MSFVVWESRIAGQRFWEARCEVCGERITTFRKVDLKREIKQKYTVLQF